MRSLVMIITIVCLSSTVFSAVIDIPETNPGLNLGGHVAFPDLKGCWGANNQGNNAYAFTHFSLKNHVLLGGGWNFDVFLEDTSEWRASLYLDGIIRDKEESPSGSPINQRFSFEGMDVSLEHWLNVDYSNDNEWLLIDGGISLAPAEIMSTSFQYDEYEDKTKPSVTRWRANFGIQGQFIANDVKEAQIIGAQLADIPEPATILLLGLGGATLFLRRHRRR